MGAGTKIPWRFAPLLFAVSPLGSVAAADQAPESGTSTYHFSLSTAAVFPFSLPTTSPTLSPARIRTRPGYELAAGVGYRTRDIRLEGKLTYGRFDADSIRFREGGGALSGYFDLHGAAIEIYYDLPIRAPLRPYLGAGLGAVRFQARDVTLAGFPPTVGANTVLSHQLMAGVSYAADAWRFVLGYRYLEMGTQDYETGGVPLRGDRIRTDAIQASLHVPF